MPSTAFSKISLANFRAFSQKSEAQLGKITLLYGQNSAGKSSIIKSLLLLQQTVQDGNDRRRGKFIFSGDSVDLGSFSTSVSNHDVSKEISVGISFSVESNRSRDPNNSITFNWHINRDQDVSQMHVTINEKEFVFHRLQNVASSQSFFALDPSCVENWCAHVSDGNDLFATNDPVLEDLTLGVGFVPVFSGGIFPINFRGSIQLQNRGALTSSRLANLKTYQPEGFDDQDDTLPIGRTPGVANNWSQELRPIVQNLSRALRNTSYLGPLRREPQRLERYMPTTTRYVGSVGEEMLSLMHEQPQLVRDVNNYLGMMDLPYRIEVVPIGEQDTVGSVIYLSLTNVATGLSLSPSDVGVGYSQVLPLITQSVLSRNSLICVEQPELHLHPAMQARLGDMFIQQSLSGHNVQFLIETHSESLMLRILRRIREGQISPKDVQVLYIDQNKEGHSEIIELPILPSGEFATPWPHGFFDERLEEFGL